MPLFKGEIHFMMENRSNKNNARNKKTWPIQAKHDEEENAHCLIATNDTNNSSFWH